MSGNVAHAADAPRKPFASGKQRIWLFLSVDLLLFGGVLCAYAVFRADHPEVFVHAHRYLSLPLGAIGIHDDVPFDQRQIPADLQDLVPLLLVLHDEEPGL